MCLACTIKNKDYHPTWYSGSDWNYNNLSSFTDSVGSLPNSAISSPSTAPGSSPGSSGFGDGGDGWKPEYLIKLTT